MSTGYSEKPASSWRRGLEGLERSDAFEPADEGRVSAVQARDLLLADRRALRRKVLLCAAVLAALLLASLCLTVSVRGAIYPGEVASCVALWFQVQFTNLFTTDVPLTVAQIQRLQPYYYEVTSRFSISVLTAVCGAMLACSGMLYQNVFRNPIAAPTMLGVQSGVNIGLVVLVLVYGTAAVYADGPRYLLCYLCVALVVGLVFGAGRLIGGKGSFNVVNMLIVGSIVSQLVGTAVTYVTNNLMDDDLFETYYLVQQQLQVDASLTSWLAVLAVFAVAAAPVVALRFGMNVLGFSDQEARFMGANATGMRVVALVSGSLMIAAATVYCGAVSMVSLMVPHIARLLFGSEFRKQLAGNMLLGAIVLLFCRDVTALVPFLSTGLPLGTVVSFVTMPFFVWILAVQQRSWE